MSNKHLEGIGFYTLEEVVHLTTLSESTLFREIKAGRFPVSIRLGQNRIGWSRGEVREWLRLKEANAKTRPYGVVGLGLDPSA